MRLRVAAAVLFSFGLALPACDLLQPDDGSTGSGGGGAGGTGGAGGSVTACESQSVDCTACRQCAAAGQCAAVVDACVDDAACSAIDECLAFCGSGADCWEMCRLQNPGGVDAYDAARGCLDCVACPTKCAGATACSG